VALRKLKDFDFEGKRVLVRCDFNVPIENGKVLDDFRIRNAIPTIHFLKENKAKIILISHFGDPEGEIVEELRLDPVAKHLQELIHQKVTKLNEAIGERVEREIDSLKEGEILMLENIRFYPGEQKNDPDFAKSLAKLGQVFINEAFSVSHRPHASVIGLPKYLPSGVGFLFEKEVRVLENFLKNYKKPLVALVGGRKVKDKAPLVEKFSEMGDWVLVNRLIWKEIQEGKVKIKVGKNVLFPIDEKDGGLDIGPKTIKLFREKILEAKTIFWNGPFGKIEDKRYIEGTKKLAEAILESKAFSLIGGGETIELTNQLGITQKFSFASTGGGALLKFLAGEKLPGLKILGYYGD